MILGRLPLLLLLSPTPLMALTASGLFGIGRLPLSLLIAPPATALVTRGLYSSPKRRSGTLAVGGGHELYWQMHGAEDESAPTAVFLHGGPGAGCFERHAGFFDGSQGWRKPAVGY